MSRLRLPGRRLVVLQLLATLLAAPFLTSVASAQSHEIDLVQLINETQQQSADPDRLTMVWWLPEEFWRASMDQEESLTSEGADELLAVVRPYALFVVLDGTLGPLGGATFRDPEELVETVALVDQNGDRHAPLPRDSVAPDARNLASMMKPMLANMLGPAGENLGFFFFAAGTSEGAPIVSATQEGEFSLEVGDQVFEWRTPLGAVLPPKICPVDHEEMSGAWSYCPWHGKKLVVKKGKDG